MLKDLEIGRRPGWIRALRGKDLHNGALVAMDHRTGDVLAYVGSAGYARNDLASREFEPKYDAAGDGARQPGSAFKPILYAAAFDAERLTPGSLLLDITTEFDRRQDWAPRDADQLDRGPVLVRRALQYSLNVPAIRALERVGNETVADTAAAMGVRFTGGRKAFLQAGLAGALGTVEVTPLDLTTAYATIANGGVRVEPRMIDEILGADGSVVWTAPEPAGERAISAERAWLVTDILQGNTDPRQNPIWAEKLRLRNGPDGEPAGRGQDGDDQRRPGPRHLRVPARPARGRPGPDRRGLARQQRPLVPAVPAPGDVAHRRRTAVARLRPRLHPRLAGDQVQAARGRRLQRIDAWTGGRPGPWTRDTVNEWFIDGTQPGRRGAVDEDGLLYRAMCGGWRVDPVKAELGPRAWRADVQDWLARARRGTGVGGRHDSRTAYFWGESSWGGPLAGACYRPKPKPRPSRSRGPTGAAKPPGRRRRGAEATEPGRRRLIDDCNADPAAHGAGRADRILRRSNRHATQVDRTMRSEMRALDRPGDGPRDRAPRSSSASSCSGSRPAGVLLLLFLAVLLASALEPGIGRLRERLPLGSGRPSSSSTSRSSSSSSAWPSSSCRPRSARQKTHRRAAAVLRAGPGVGPRSAAGALRPRPPALVEEVAQILAPPPPPDPDTVVEVGTVVAEATVALVTLLTIVYFWLVEHARLQRYVLAFLPADAGPARATRGTRSRRASACGSAASSS